MNCFNHSSKSAVGICKHCNKAICHECITDTGDGIACAETCVETVHALNNLIDRNRQTASAQRKNAYLSPVFLGGMGAIFLVFGLSGVQDAPLPIAMGIGLLIFSFVYAVRVRHWLG